jgi:hypothetical protein
MASRITILIDPFNAYITSTDNFLQAFVEGSTTIKNWERLGLSMANADEWHSRRQAWDLLYIKYNDASLSTGIVKKQVHNFIDSFREFGGPQLNIMAASENADETDEAKFNFVITPADATHSTTPIAEGVAVEVKHRGSSEVEFICKTGEGTAKPEGADSVQVAWMIIEDQPVTPGPVPTPPSEDDMPDYDDPRMTKEIFTKSHFIKHFGGDNVTKRVVCFFRWYNTKHPDLAGPWTEIMAVVIA